MVSNDSFPADLWIWEDDGFLIRYFNRDVECIRTFFRRRFKYESALYPRFKSVQDDKEGEGFQLDVMVAASGFAKKDQKILEEVRSRTAIFL